MDIQSKNNLQKLPRISDRELKLRALTHRSYINENPQEGEDNERLEFLGDAVLGFLVGELLYSRYPQMSEAQLTRLRSALVDEKQLASFARQLDLGEQMRLGKGAIKDGGRENPSLLCDTFEALIGAYLLDSNIESVRAYVKRLFEPEADTMVNRTKEKPKNLVDPKNRFQQWALKMFLENPEYAIVGESGPEHSKEFTAEVRVKGKAYGTGKGGRKQDAQKHAAEDALKKLGL
ncbi:MAG: ribonuclease III [Oscillatoria sp. SIO1A7]|nr:ribonuclease III [Oscillatoria sp. SIO1A7]